MSAVRFVVVGIGADGWEGLTRAAQNELAGATTILGSPRQLAMLDGHVSATIVPWRSPMNEHLDELAPRSSGEEGSSEVRALRSPGEEVTGSPSAEASVRVRDLRTPSAEASSRVPDLRSPSAEASVRVRALRSPSAEASLRASVYRGAGDPTHPTHILASGDPMFHGVGASIIARVGADAVRVIPAVSSASLAAARLGWDLARTQVVSLVTASPSTILAHASGGTRLLVLSRDARTPSNIAELLCDNHFGASSMTVLEQLGGPAERIRSDRADVWKAPDVDPLNIVALQLRGPKRIATPGLDDTAYDHDGQLTKRVVRALTVSALAPSDGQLLWDVGAGSGSVGIEWLRVERSSRAIAFETVTTRAGRITGNAARHGVADRLTIVGAAPAAFSKAPDPDTVFVGGGLDRTLFDAAWARLRPGGRLVVNAVTVENQTLLATLFAEFGGTMTRLGIEQAGPLGTMTTWRPLLPIVQWVVEKGSGE
nr:precorrin-6y C5,15-methyltransferase (decarboxylating) subunit CbiE [Gordonia asplenii]